MATQPDSGSKTFDSSSLYSVGQDSAIQMSDSTILPPYPVSQQGGVPEQPPPDDSQQDEDEDGEGGDAAVIPYDNASDSGWDSGSLIGDDTYTLASSIMNYRLENGRQYHAYRDGAYWGPNDEHAKEVLDFAHHLYLLTLDHKLHLAPVKNPQTILDVGTGTGIWAVDMADQYPGATVTGTDLSPMQPEWVPSNCHFEIDDVTLEWTFPKDHFDFIHIRELFGCVPDWDSFFAQAYEHTKPGGWVEIVEHSVHPIATDGSMPKDHFFHTWGQTVIEMGIKFGKSFTIWEESKSRMEKAGFVDVVEYHYQWPMNGWAQEKKLKTIGRWNQLRLHNGVEGFMLRLLTQVGGWSVARAQVFLAEMRKSLKDYKTHAFLPGTVVYGRKPLRPHYP